MIGFPLGILLAVVLVFALLTYEDGLNSAGIESVGIQDAIGGLQDAGDESRFHRGESLGPAVSILVYGLLGSIFFSVCLLYTSDAADE